MKITAKVKCGSRIQLDGDLDMVNLYADYLGEGAVLNMQWSRHTPAMSIQMNIRRDVPFTPGKSYTLTFDDGDDT